MEAQLLTHLKRIFITTDDLKSTLSYLASKEALSEVDSQKTDKGVTNNNILAINVLFKQLELSVIITVEYLKSLTEKSEKNTGRERHDFLYKQAKTLLKWINLKNIEEEGNLAKEMDQDPSSIQADALVGVREFTKSDKEILKNSIQKGTKDEATMRYRLDERVKSKLQNFAKAYSSSRKNRSLIRDSTDNSLRTLIMNKSMVSKNLKMREPMGKFKFQNKRASHCDIRENITSLDRHSNAPNIPKLYNGSGLGVKI